MSLTFTILGCGSSMGVPRITGEWGACDPNEPKNRRTRCAMLIRKVSKNGETTVLIDAGVDMRHQLLQTKVKKLDAVLLTHEHADHIYGLDDLRAFALENREQVPVYMSDVTYDSVVKKFDYCFIQAKGSYYPAILNRMEVNYDQSFTVDGAGGAIEILPVRVNHGSIDCTAFLIDGVMYSADISDIPQSSLYAFEDLDIWVIDALQPKTHGSHFGLVDALHWVRKMNSNRSILTNLSTEMDFQWVKGELSEQNLNITIAYDGHVFSK